VILSLDLLMIIERVEIEWVVMAYRKFVMVGKVDWVGREGRVRMYMVERLFRQMSSWCL
jgi:hypothetical protein